MQVGGWPALVCGALEGLAPHLFTTRHWRLGTAAGDEGAEAWSDVARGLAVGPERLVRARQVHGPLVIVRREGARQAPRELSTGDIIISNDPGVAVAVQAADCVPILIADRRTGAVAAAHAGWRGLAVRVPSVAVRALEREFGSRPEDLVACTGPAIGACCYQVGSDVRGAFEGSGFSDGDIARWFHAEPKATPVNASMAGLVRSQDREQWYLDCASSARDQLIASGIPPEQVHVAGLCTASHPGVFCSFRRDGAPAGRMAAIIRRVKSEV